MARAYTKPHLCKVSTFPTHLIKINVIHASLSLVLCNFVHIFILTGFVILEVASWLFIHSNEWKYRKVISVEIFQISMMVQFFVCRNCRHVNKKNFFAIYLQMNAICVSDGQIWYLSSKQFYLCPQNKERQEWMSLLT